MFHGNNELGGGGKMLKKRKQAEQLSLPNVNGASKLQVEGEEQLGTKEDLHLKKYPFPLQGSRPSLPRRRLGSNNRRQNNPDPLTDEENRQPPATNNLPYV